MIKIKSVQSIICLVIIIILANHAWAADWIFYASSPVGDMYYDKSGIKKVNTSIIPLWTKTILSDDAKTKYFSLLKNIDKAPGNPSILSYYLEFLEIDCVNKKIINISVTIYDEKSNVLYSSPKVETGEWNDILPNSYGEILKNMACEEPVTPKKVAVTGSNITPVNSKQNEKKYSPAGEDVRNLVLKWAASWESGDMKTYRSYYASDFQSKGMNLNDWVLHKTNVFQKSKNINISIDDLQILEEGNSVTAVFTQTYSSSILQDKGKKTLELRKIDNQWKIYREIM
jgi:ketosteroid isomerase-like protein